MKEQEKAQGRALLDIIKEQERVKEQERDGSHDATGGNFVWDTNRERYVLKSKIMDDRC